MRRAAKLKTLFITVTRKPTEPVAPLRLQPARVGQAAANSTGDRGICSRCMARTTLGYAQALTRARALIDKLGAEAQGDR